MSKLFYIDYVSLNVDVEGSIWRVSYIWFPANFAHFPTSRISSEEQIMYNVTAQETLLVSGTRGKLISMKAIVAARKYPKKY